MKFHIGQILSVTTGKLVSNNGIDGVYEILNYMTRKNLYTHQLPRALSVCKPHMLKHHPDLGEVTADNVSADNIRAWIADMVEKYGEFREVARLPEGAF